jgi:hypothetical protein
MDLCHILFHLTNKQGDQKGGKKLPNVFESSLNSCQAKNIDI